MSLSSDNQPAVTEPRVQNFFFRRISIGSICILLAATSLGLTEFGGPSVRSASAAALARKSPAPASTSPVSPGRLERLQDRKEIQDKSFDDLKFDIEVGGEFDRSMLTEDIKNLVGKKIRIRGYMRPSFQQDGIRQFILVRDNLECCFGPGAAIYDCILVKMEGEKSTSFSVRPIAVEGVLKVEEFEGPDGRLWAIYRMVAERVR